MVSNSKWVWPWKLKQKGVLGINARNLFINEVNERKFYPKVDDKVLTKKLCKQLDVPVPETYGVIKRLGDVKTFSDLIKNQPGFVVKPANGAGGRGIIVVTSHDGNEYKTPSGVIYNDIEVAYQMATILSGAFSLSGQPDKVILEQCIKPHNIFSDLAVSGTPDIRIIIYRNKPILGMLRLPTKASRGRANLHQGAVGVGIDIDSGKTHGGVFRDSRVTYHPDTKVSMQGREIPHWEKILDICSCLSQAIELGYLGVDIVLDVNEGPLVLEANARPGLAIQTANGLGLKTKLG